MTEYVKIEKEVWESTLRASMDRAGELEKTKKQLEIAEEAIKRAYQKCEICYNGVCQYCSNAYIVRYWKDKKEVEK